MSLRKSNRFLWFVSLAMVMLAVFLCIDPSSPSHAALARKIVFDVRTGGSDTNGGCFDPTVTVPGTDFSQQNGAQVAYTDLVIGASTSTLTSAGNPFGATTVGNCIQVTSGTGFTIGTYEILSVSGVVATMDRSVGTTASTGGNGNLGGARANILSAILSGGVNSFSQNIVYAKSGTYTYTTQQSLAPSGGTAYLVEGYGTTHGDLGTAPLMTTATNSVNLFVATNGNNIPISFKNVNFSNTAGTPGAGLVASSGAQFVVWGCTLTGFTNAIQATANNLNPLQVLNSRITASTGAGIALGSSTTAAVFIMNSSIDNNTGNGITVSNSASNALIVIDHTLIVKNGGIGYSDTLTNTEGYLSITNSTIAGNTSDGLAVVNVGGNNPFKFLNLRNNIFYGNGGWGINYATANTGQLFAAITGNAFGANTSGASTITTVGPITLSGDPFVSSAGNNFALNATAGAGGALRGTGFPGVFPLSTTTGYSDVGAVQHQDTGGGGTVSNYGTAY